jgi:hypothetical protein
MLESAISYPMAAMGCLDKKSNFDLWPAEHQYTHFRHLTSRETLLSTRQHFNGTTNVLNSEFGGIKLCANYYSSYY